MYGDDVYDDGQVLKRNRETHARTYKNTYFLYRELPWGLPSHAVHFFGKLSSSHCYAPFDTCRLTLQLTFSTFEVKLGFWGGTPKGRLCVRDLQSCKILRRYNV